MSEANIQVVRALWRAFDTADVDTLRALYAPGFVWHGLGPAPGRDSGVEHEVSASLATKKRLTQFGHVIDHIFGQGDLVVMISRGGGALIDDPRSEVKRTTVLSVYRVSGGQVHEVWAMPDLVSFLLNYNAITLSPLARQMIGMDDKIDWDKVTGDLSSKRAAQVPTGAS